MQMNIIVYRKISIILHIKQHNLKLRTAKYERQNDARERKIPISQLMNTTGYRETRNLMILCKEAEYMYVCMYVCICMYVVCM